MLPDPYKALATVQSTNKILFASASPNFGYAIFARDAIEACLDIIPTLEKEIAQPIVLQVIKTLAHLQGTKSPEKVRKGRSDEELADEEKAQIAQLDLTEERKGKIHHEHRAIIMDGVEIPERAKMILRYLSDLWGGTFQEVTYYGSVDATPLYVRLITTYCNTYGRDLLSEQYINKDGIKCTIQQSLLLALTYIDTEIHTSDLGFYEMKRLNPQGLRNQTWKDSPPSFIDTDGTLANYTFSMAPLALQGLAYDALTLGGKLLEKEFPKEAVEWNTLAHVLQKETLTKFWMEDKQYFAQVLHRDEHSAVKQLKTITSDAGTLLDTTFFDTVEKQQKIKYISGIVSTLFSKNFVTDAGIRCRSLEHIGLVDYSDYHGVEAVWPKETFDIKEGLRKQGFLRLADQLGVRLINSLRISGSYYELFIVRPDGRVNFDPKEKHSEITNRETIVATSIPEDMQTWTITAYLAEITMRAKGCYSDIHPNSWQYILEDSLLPILQKQEVVSLEKAADLLPKNYGFRISVEEGQKRAKKYENILVDLFAPQSSKEHALVHEA